MYLYTDKKNQIWKKGSLFSVVYLVIFWFCQFVRQHNDQINAFQTFILL